MKQSLAAALVTLLCLACSAGTDARTSSSASDTSNATVIAALRAEGVNLKEVQTLEQPFFPVPAHVFTAGGEDLQLYEFSSADEAQRAASSVDARGTTIGTTKMSWMAPPHFFRKDRVLAIHLGSSKETQLALEHVMGKPFAGGS